MRVDKLIGEETLESGLVLFDRSLPPAFSGLADAIGRVYGEQESGTGYHQQEQSHRLLPSYHRTFTAA
jgi:hypothetical protein